MKKTLLVGSLISTFILMTAFATSKTILTSTEITQTSDYCKGWADGYCEGWRDIKGSMALCPLTPLCPLAELGKTRYTDGYNRGFKAGSSAAQK